MVYQDCDKIDILVQKRKDKRAAMRFFKRLLKGQGVMPLKILTGKLASYSAVINNLFRPGRHLMQGNIIVFSAIVPLSNGVGLVVSKI